MKKPKSGEEVYIVIGNRRKLFGMVIDQKDWEERYGKFDYGDDVIIIMAGSGHTILISLNEPEEVL